MTEAQHQINVIKWTQQPGIRRKYPELKLLYHIPNERKCSQIQGRQLKLQGVKSGVPDLHLPVARGEYLSLYIELKAEKGKVSDNQNCRNKVISALFATVGKKPLNRWRSIYADKGNRTFCC